MNFVDKGLSVDNGCFRYQSLFLQMCFHRHFFFLLNIRLTKCNDIVFFILLYLEFVYFL